MFLANWPIVPAMMRIEMKKQLKFYGSIGYLKLEKVGTVNLAIRVQSFWR